MVVIILIWEGGFDLRWFNTSECCIFGNDMVKMGIKEKDRMYVLVWLYVCVCEFVAVNVILYF